MTCRSARCWTAPAPVTTSSRQGPPPSSSRTSWPRWNAPSRGAAPPSSGRTSRRSTSTGPCPTTRPVLEEVRGLYLDDAVWFHHPRYLAHLNCPVAIPALVGEAGAVGGELLAGHVGPECRRHADRAAADRLDGRADRAWRAAPTGCSPAAARRRTCRRCCSLGRRRRQAAGPACRTAWTRLRIFASPDSHFSVRKSASHARAGPGRGRAGADRRGPADRTDGAGQGAGPAAHRRGLCRWRSWPPPGPPTSARIDPLAGDRPTRSRVPGRGCTSTPRTAAGCWSPAAPAPARRDRTRGLGDGGLPQDVLPAGELQRGAGPRRGRRCGTSTYHADYLNPEDARPPRAAEPGGQEPADHPPIRRAEALVDVRIMGADAIGSLFDEVVDRADEAWQAAGRRPEVRGRAVRPQLSTLVFRYAPDRGGRTGARRGRTGRPGAIVASGVAVVGGTGVDGRDVPQAHAAQPRDHPRRRRAGPGAGAIARNITREPDSTPRRATELPRRPPGRRDARPHGRPVHGPRRRGASGWVRSTSAWPA